MNWLAWVIFAIELILKFSPYVRELAQFIAEKLDTKKDEQGLPLSGEQKKILFDSEFTRTMTAKQGVMPNYTMVSKAREWNLQKLRGKEWQSPLGAQVGLDKFYG